MSDERGERGALEVAGTTLASEGHATLRLPASAEREPSDLGVPGPPVNKRNPFYVGFTGALGVALAYVLVRAIVDVSSVLLILGVSLFLAVGFDPLVKLLSRASIGRGLATVVIIVCLLACIAGFLAAAVPAISSEVHALVVHWPKYRRDVMQGKGTIGHLAKSVHVTRYFTTKSVDKVREKIEAGAFGAGKVVVSAAVAAIATLVLTIYFLVALPAVKRVWLSLFPRTRRERVGALTEEMFSRVGGFVLGNLITSLVAGIGTFIWLLIFSVPYPFLLSLMVAVFDLIPLVGSTIAGVVVSLVALSEGLPIALATAAFYLAWRFLEDYLLTPRVMRHTVQISPGLTIVATLIGGALLGLIGALVAIPVAATVRLLLEEVVTPRLNRS